MKRAVSISLFDQALLSAFNLLLSLALVRFAGPADFGKFTFVATFILIFTSIQHALVTMPISVLLPARPEAERAGLLAELVSFDVLVRAAMTLCVVLACAWVDSDPLLLAAAAAATFTTLTRECMRAISVARDRMVECLAIDALAVAASVVAAVLLAMMLTPPVACLAGIAIGNLASLLVFGPRVLPKHLLVRDAVARYAVHWPDTRWSLSGAAATEVQYRLYVFALQGFRGTAVLGQVQAGRLLLGPLNLFVQAWGRVARPRMAAALAEKDGRRALNILLSGLALMTAIAALYLTAVYLAWPWLEPAIYKGRYADIGLIAAAWGLYTIINVADICIGVLVQSAYRLRALAHQSIGVGIVSGLLMLGLASEVHAVYAIFAIMGGEIVGLVWSIWLAWRVLREAAAPAAQGS